MKKLMIALLTILGTQCISSTTDNTYVTAQRHNADFGKLMEQKLRMSNSILEGLVRREFRLIGSGAKSLHLLSTESGWNVLQSAQYAEHSREFRQATKKLVAAAKEKNIDRATIGYTSLVFQCVECHSYMQRQKSIDLKSNQRVGAE